MSFHLSINPKSLFPGQQPGEKVYLLTRQHWIIFAKEFVIWLFFVAALLLIDLLLENTVPFVLQSPFVETLAVAKTVYLMYLVAGLFALWIQYDLNYQIVTNERLVDVDQKNLLNHTTSELHMHNIEDVTAEIRGILGTVFNFGTIYVQTAGQKTFFEFNNIPNPHRVAKLILDLYERLPDINTHGRNHFKKPTHGYRKSDSGVKKP